MRQKNRKQYKELTESNKQHLNSILVDKEVWCCVSSEVDYILKQSCDDSDCPFSYDDIDNLLSEPDEGQPEQQEILEWWKVSSWLLNKLSDAGEPTIKDFNLWGRTTSGQSIAIDGDIYTFTRQLWDEGHYFDDSKLDEEYFKK